MRKYMFSMLLLIFSTACFSQGTIFDNTMMNVNVTNHSVTHPNSDTQIGVMNINVDGEQSIFRYVVNNTVSNATLDHSWQNDGYMQIQYPAIIYPFGQNNNQVYDCNHDWTYQYFWPNYRQ